MNTHTHTKALDKIRALRAEVEHLKQQANRLRFAIGLMFFVLVTTSILLIK